VHFGALRPKGPRPIQHTHKLAYSALFPPPLLVCAQVRYVQRVEDADVVVHKRPQPGEKQFAYQTVR